MDSKQTGWFMVQSSGIFADKNIISLLGKSILTEGQPFDLGQIQPASLDLRLGPVAYRVRASFMPGPNVPVTAKLERLKLHEIDLRQGGVLETGCVYIVPLQERLDLPDMVSALANPKSSTGRIDVFTRVITDGAREFDKIAAGYCGPLYLEISPRTFPIIVRMGSRLSQMRFRIGDGRLDGHALHVLHNTHRLISKETLHIHGDGVALSVDLHPGSSGLIGYRAKKHTGIIDVDQRGVYEIAEFWEPIYRRGIAELVLDPNEFYILVSCESVHIPPFYAAEMCPFDPLIGEFRVHYAGFFDPGFGHMTKESTTWDSTTWDSTTWDSANMDPMSAHAVLEVRSHEVPFILEHGQIIGYLVYEHMIEQPEALYGAGLGSNYQSQGLKLSKHFKSDRDLIEGKMHE